MKRKNRISQLTLELYLRGLATYKERRQVEKALKTDIEFKKRYETFIEQDREINQSITQELTRKNIQIPPPAVPKRKVNLVWGLAAAALILLCAGIPLFLYFKNSSANKHNVITEETAPENKTSEKIKDTPSVEQPDKNEKIAENLRSGQSTPKSSGGSHATTEKETNPKSSDFQSVDSQSGKTEIATAPAPDNGVRMRGDGQTKDQRGSTAVPEESNLNIPPGITFIFENMFANKFLVGIVIPDRIKSIAKNAFAGNPVLTVTIGANVDVDDEAIPGNFAKAYNANGKSEGIYTRPNNNSEMWEKLKE